VVVQGKIDNFIITVQYDNEEEYYTIIIETVKGFRAWRDTPFYHGWIFYRSKYDFRDVEQSLRKCIEHVKKEPPDILFPIPPAVAGYTPETDAIKIHGDQYEINAPEMSLSELVFLIKNMNI